MRGSLACVVALACLFGSSLALGGVPSYTLSPPSQTIGVGQMATVTITQSFVLNNDNSVVLASSDTGVLTVPASVTIFSQATTAQFQVQGLAVGTADVIADPNAQDVTASITVSASPPDASMPDGSLIDAAEQRDSSTHDAAGSGGSGGQGGSSGSGGSSGTSGGTSSNSGCGCVVGGGTPSGGWMVLLMIPLLLRRRRSQR